MFLKEKSLDASQLVNLSSYPLLDLKSPVGRAFALSCRQEYQETGLCLLPDFITPEATEVLTAEASSFTDEAYFCDSSHNAYLTGTNDKLPNDDIVNRQEQTYVGSVPYDRIDPNSQLNSLYQWNPLMDFIGFVLGKETFYRFADPFGACSINVFVDGGMHGWHFDESEFTVTLMLQRPEIGGTFEYLPKIRGLSDEKQRVSEALDGSREGVVELPFTPGTLLIFGGNQTLHRVTKVSGNTPRLVPVLCYSETPDLMNSEAVRKLFWGRSGPDEITPSGATA